MWSDSHLRYTQLYSTISFKPPRNSQRSLAVSCLLIYSLGKHWCCASKQPNEHPRPSNSNTSDFNNTSQHKDIPTFSSKTVSSFSKTSLLTWKTSLTSQSILRTLSKLIFKWTCSKSSRQLCYKKYSKWQ